MTLDEQRSQYKATAERIIAVRRYPESQSQYIIVETDHWRRNWVCDVYDVGDGVYCSETGERIPFDIRVGDAVIVNPLDGEQLDKASDPMLLSIKVNPEYSDEYDDNHIVYKGVVMVLRSERYIHKDTGFYVRALPVGHILYVERDSNRNFYPPDSMMVTWLPDEEGTIRHVSKQVVLKEAFDEEFEYAPDEDLTENILIKELEGAK